MFNKNLSGKIVAGLLPILAVCCVVGLFAEKAFGASKADRPNVLVVITDQQSARMMSCAGNKYLKTPNMDFLASVGTRFERAYVTNPVCLPARFSFMTGRYPSVVGVRHNSQGHGAKNVPQYAKDALGNLLKKAGYRTVFGGKRHLPAEMGKIENCGFEVLTNDTRFVLAESCADFFQQEQEKPFLLMAMLINPHDICYQAIRSHSEWRKKIKKVPAPLAEAMKLPEGMSKEQFFAEVCPPLPANFEPMDLEPEAYSFLLDLREFRRHARDNWKEEEWRMHRWAYCRLTELVDKKIGIILDGLRKSPYADNTLVIFSSDHGDHDASHRLEHKTLFYEEAMNVPLIVCPPGSLVQKANKPTKVNNQNLVCIGTDLLPTVCDYAGAKAPEDLPGRSFRPLLAGKKVKDWPEAILIENQVGDAVVTADWKYASMLDQKDIPKLNPKKYSNPKVTKILCHLSEDPGEMKNLAYLPKYKKKVKQMQALLDELQKTQCKK